MVAKFLGVGKGIMKYLCHLFIWAYKKVQYTLHGVGGMVRAVWFLFLCKDFGEISIFMGNR